MWHIVLITNSILLALSALYLVYSFGHLILTFSWKEFLLALVIFAFLAVAEVALGAINS